MKYIIIKRDGKYECVPEGIYDEIVAHYLEFEGYENFEYIGELILNQYNEEILKKITS